MECPALTDSTVSMPRTLRRRPSSTEAASTALPVPRDLLDLPDVPDPEECVELADKPESPDATDSPDSPDR
ncbi:hypothetical protein L596_018867 [Steinernema carpocapsae]|uniref:Uncharacterized protein n=1 Tax=Steinernema carpocapsae TaxID=34508 RepID=A0A4U5N5X6_STECR|nr:hypothetical protein L596_018867 [Steinernema carpocapsae]